MIPPNTLSNKTLLQTMHGLATQERAILSKVLWHLREIDQRKLYSDLKCGSLYEYCVKVLKYSEGQASRRVSASRLLKELPEISKEVESGELNLTQLNLAKQFFHEELIDTKDKKQEILDLIKGKTTRETDKILWDLRKEDTPRKVSITLKEDTVVALRNLRGLKAHSCTDMDSLLMKMHDLALGVWTPKQKRASVGSNPSNRYISINVKEQVWNRDKGKCQNCGSTFAIQYDHKKPFADGGKTEISNMQLLCRNCNQRKGNQRFFMTSTSCLM